MSYFHCTREVWIIGVTCTENWNSLADSRSPKVSCEQTLDVTVGHLHVNERLEWLTVISMSGPLVPSEGLMGLEGSTSASSKLLGRTVFASV